MVRGRSGREPAAVAAKNVLADPGNRIPRNGDSSICIDSGGATSRIATAIVRWFGAAGHVVRNALLPGSDNVGPGARSGSISERRR